MTSLFNITVVSNSVNLNEKGEANSPFTVENRSGRIVRGRAVLEILSSAAKDWVKLSGESEHEFAIGETIQILVSIKVPRDAAPGAYKFRLNMVDTSNPDENFTQGPDVTFNVPVPETKTLQPFPWWILVVAAAAVVLIVVVVLLITQPWNSPAALQPTAAPSPTSTSAPTNTPPPAATATPACFVYPAGLVGWWPMDGNGADKRNNNDARVFEGTFVPGKVGQALQFSASGPSYAMVNASPGLDVGLGSGFTIDVWVNPTTNTGFQALVEWNRGPSNPAGAQPYGVHLWLFNQPGQLFANIWRVNTQQSTIFADPGVVKAGEFSHVALTYDRVAATAKLYHNGEVAKIGSASGSVQPQTSYDLYFGLRPLDTGLGGPGGQFRGLMDEIDLFNRALSDSEVKSIFSAGSMCRKAGS